MKKILAIVALFLGGTLVHAEGEQGDSPLGNGSNGDVAKQMESIVLAMTNATSRLEETATKSENTYTNMSEQLSEMLPKLKRIADTAQQQDVSPPNAESDKSSHIQLLGLKISPVQLSSMAVLFAAMSALAAIVACFFARKADCGAKVGDSITAIKGLKETEEKAIGDLKAQVDLLQKALTGKDSESLPGQIDAVKKSIDAVNQAICGNFGDRIKRLEANVADIPAKFGVTFKSALQAEVESLRCAIFKGIFGGDEAVSGSEALLPKIQRSMENSEDKLRSGLRTDKELQKWEQELNLRESAVKVEWATIKDKEVVAYKKGAEESESRCKLLEKEKQDLMSICDNERIACEKRFAEQGERYGKALNEREFERNAANIKADEAEKAKREAESRLADAEKQITNVIAAREATLKAMETARSNAEVQIKNLMEAARAKDEAIRAERATMQEKIRQEIESENAILIAKLKADANESEEKRKDAEKEALSLRTEKEELAKRLDDKGHELSVEQERHKADVDKAAKALAAEQSGRAADRAAAAALLETEKKGRIADAEAAAAKLEAEKKARAADKATADAAMSATKARLFPQTFGSDEVFSPLFAELDAWDIEGLPGAALARASLAIIANREHLSDTIWQNALFDLSLGLSLAMEARKIAAADAAAILGKWKTAIEGLRETGPSFSLNLPTIGRSVDMSWMHSQSNAGTVRRIRSWAVYNRSGLVCLAEVE